MRVPAFPIEWKGGDFKVQGVKVHTDATDATDKAAELPVKGLKFKSNTNYH